MRALAKMQNCPMRKLWVIPPTPRTTPWKQNASISSATPSKTWLCARKSYGGIFDFDAKYERLRTVNASLEDPAVWNDPKKAQELGKEQKSLSSVVVTLDKLTRELADNTELYEMSKEEGDEPGLMTIEAETAKLRPLIEELEFRRMFRNEADPLNCFVDIQAGAGGTEACDWAGMLLRQYLKYAERKGFKATVDEETPGDVAGIKSATIHIEGEYAYGLLRTETGVHRLVRKSPCDSSGGRHTSFASVFVYPEIDDSIEIDINPADVRVDTYRASGAGGQHINKTDSAGGLNMRRNSSSSTVFSSLATSSAMACRLASSSSSRLISNSSALSARSRVSSSSVTTTPSSAFFSLPSSWAFLGSFQTAGSSSAALTVLRRSALAA